MRIEFDPEKNNKNIIKRNLNFERAAEIDFSSAKFIIDDRHDYGETRQIAVCYLDKRLHILCFTEIKNGIRVISFRKANSREAKKYEKPITIN